MTKLFEPFVLGNLTLKNRIIMAGMHTEFGRDGYLTERELAYYEDENGSYRADIIASPTIQGGQTYKRMQFRVYNTAGIEFTRLELVDVETGQVLIEDIQRAYYHQADEVFGTQLETYQYGEAAVEPSPSPPAVESRLQEDAGS